MPNTAVACTVSPSPLPARLVHDTISAPSATNPETSDASTSNALATATATLRKCRTVLSTFPDTTSANNPLYTDVAYLARYLAHIRTYIRKGPPLSPPAESAILADLSIVDAALSAIPSSASSHRNSIISSLKNKKGKTSGKQPTVSNSPPERKRVSALQFLRGRSARSKARRMLSEACERTRLCAARLEMRQFATSPLGHNENDDLDDDDIDDEDDVVVDDENVNIEQGDNELRTNLRNTMNSKSQAVERATSVIKKGTIKSNRKKATSNEKKSNINEKPLWYAHMNRLREKDRAGSVSRMSLRFSLRRGRQASTHGISGHANSNNNTASSTTASGRGLSIKFPRVSTWHERDRRNEDEDEEDEEDDEDDDVEEEPVKEVAATQKKRPPPDCRVPAPITEASPTTGAATADDTEPRSEECDEDEEDEVTEQTQQVPLQNRLQLLQSQIHVREDKHIIGIADGKKRVLSTDLTAPKSTTIIELDKGKTVKDRDAGKPKKKRRPRDSIASVTNNSSVSLPTHDAPSSSSSFTSGARDNRLARRSVPGRSVTMVDACLNTSSAVEATPSSSATNDESAPADETTSPHRKRERNVWRAASMYKVAAEKGDMRAMCDLGTCYQTGVGVERDPARAVALFTEAAGKGLPRAQFCLARCYAFGEGVPRDMSKALELYRSAATGGHAAAMCNLGVCLQKGVGVSADPQQAVALYRRAGHAGYARAWYNLGVCYESGVGVSEQSVSKAVALYKKSARGGFASAMCTLGACYESGTGVEQDVDRAVTWYRRASRAGCARAHLFLGLCYERGCGAELDVKEAKRLFKKAAEAGLQDAAVYLKSMNV